MLQKFKDFASSRSKNEWRQHFYMLIEELKSWLSNNGVQSAIVGFIAGAILVIFFRFVIYLLVLAVLVAYAIWFWAKESDDTPKIEETPKQ